jgi:DNA (cytosine-5)-methyltransferase 3A
MNFRFDNSSITTKPLLMWGLKTHIMKVLSLFNGMNCIGLALSELGIDFDLYASEIDKYGTQVSDALFPNTVNLGDVRTVNVEELPVFDLVVAGSPCQGFSFAGKQLNFDDDRSKLFFDFVKILEACKKRNPDVKFLLENVKMKKEYEAVISRFMGIDPIEINSALLSAQTRTRIYWTNIGTSIDNLFGIEEVGIKQPKDKGILLKDILELEVDDKYLLSKKVRDRFKLLNNSFCVGTTKPEFRTIGQRDLVYGEENKMGCLMASDYKQPKQVLIVPEATKQGYTEIKDGECVDLTFIDSKTRRGRKMEDKSNCLTAANYDFCQWKDAKIRRLTPKECMRLQTVPEWAIEKMLNCGVSDSQLYKMLGNGWTVAVITYILSHEYK